MARAKVGVGENTQSGTSGRPHKGANRSWRDGQRELPLSICAPRDVLGRHCQ